VPGFSRTEDPQLNQTRVGERSAPAEQPNSPKQTGVRFDVRDE